MKILVIDLFLRSCNAIIIEDKGALEQLDVVCIGQAKPTQVVQQEKHKWKVDGRKDWKKYQQAVWEGFLD